MFYNFDKYIWQVWQIQFQSGHIYCATFTNTIVNLDNTWPDRLTCQSDILTDRFWGNMQSKINCYNIDLRDATYIEFVGEYIFHQQNCCVSSFGGVSIRRTAWDQNWTKL